MVLDTLFGWALEMPLWAGILSLAAVITILMNLVYALVTDQKEMRRLKTKMKDLQKQMRENRADQAKAMQIQKKLLKLNGEYSKKSLKPTLYTLIPIFIVFAWMAANFAYAPVLADEPVTFTVEMERATFLTIEGVSVQGNATKQTAEREVSWLISAPNSTTFSVTTREGESIERELVIGSVAETNVVSHDDPFRRSTIDYPKATPFGDFEIFGYRPGWLFTYIIFSVVLSIGIRKAFRLS